MYIPTTLDALNSVYQDNEAFRNEYAFLTPTHPFYNDVCLRSDNDIAVKFSDKFGLSLEQTHAVLALFNPIIYFCPEHGYMLLYGFEAISSAAIHMRLADPVFQAEQILKEIILESNLKEADFEGEED